MNPSATPDITPPNAASGLGPTSRTLEPPGEHHVTGAARHKLVWSMLITSIALFACYMAAGSVLLPAQVNELDPSAKEANLAIVTSISSFATMFIQPLVGALSDKLQRRKMFVVIATLLIAIGCIFPLLMPTTTGILLYSVVAGAGFGAYMAVDVALAVDVLPSPEEAATCLGIINIANNVPQMLSPIIYAGLIAAFGYSSLWVWAIVIVVVASLLVLPIKKVR